MPRREAPEECLMAPFRRPFRKQCRRGCLADIAQLPYGCTMMPSRDDVIRLATDVLVAREEVLEAYLFGSIARGEAGTNSDVDIAVYVAEPHLESGPFGLEAELAASLMAALKVAHVDVVALNKATPLLYQRVLRDGVRLFSRDQAATTSRESRAISRYCDFVPHLKKIERAVRRRMDAGDFGR